VSAGASGSALEGADRPRDRPRVLRLPDGAGATAPLSIVHPEVFIAKLDRAATIGGVLKRWRRALRRSLRG